ncbi:MAG TPA: penicillin-binding transpeptidase domain-containing protein [Candidatus Acidoferrales bacterium]|nr:penicillin-binding transpeptidase domain-containing protein [Candidatus Acidoferrales bacterium]
MELRTPRIRLFIVAVLAVLWMGAVLARLSYLQLFRYTEYLGRAQRQQQRIIEISPKRGVLYDRNLRELAMSISVDSLFAVPSEIADPPMVARLLSGVLRTSADDIETKMRGSRSFVWLARKLPPDMVQRIESLNLRGIYFQKESRRFYPKRELAAHVLGYVDVDEKGLAGIEYEFDKQVRPRPGKLMILADARRRWYDRSEQAADAGESVALTLDEKIQYIAEKELAAAIEKTRAQAGSIVVQDPNTGELLAAANFPTFNPNAPGESPAESHMNRAIAATYEPGSTFKIVTVAAALEEGITRPEEVLDCQMGAIYINGHRIRDHKPFGLLTVSEIVAKSSDVGAIKLGLRLGAPKLYDYIRAFGFGQPTGIELPGETRGLLKRAESWTAASVGAISMGQEVGVTSVQLITAFSAIANGGVLNRPRIVRELRRGPQTIPVSGALPSRVISPKTAATLRRMFEGVILEGTGNRARLDGYTAAGKTGTAQKLDPNTGTYSRTQFIASFVGFAPVNTPAITVLVTLDSPMGGYHGGDVAAPVFKRVAEQVLAYLDVPHDVPLMPSQILTAKRNESQPRPDVSDFDPSQMETAGAPSALPVFPPEPVAQPAWNVAPTVALAEGEGVLVPRLAGLTVRSVTEQCLKLGLNPVLIGTGVALEQNPEAGASVRVGSRITVRFSRASGAGTN